MHFQIRITSKSPLEIPFPNVSAEKDHSVSFDSVFIKQHFWDFMKWFELGVLSGNIDVQFDGKDVNEVWLKQWISEICDAEKQLNVEAELKTIEPQGWGTKLLSSISRYLPESIIELHASIHWFQVGRFVKRGVWEVDKTQIKAILEQEARDKFLFLCPSFHFDEVGRVIDRLPDFVDTNQNVNWSVVWEPILEGTRIRNQATGIVHKITKNKISGSKKEISENKSEERSRNIPKVSFSEIGGIHRIVGTIREVIELPIKRPDVFKHLGIKPHKGVMLYGPPGCGKTMIAKAIANEIQAHFISVKGPEILNKYYGQSEENLRDIFAEAAEFAPSVIFFDEIDALAQSRTGLETLRMDDRLVNQLLSLMDGVEEFSNVSLLAATNRPELIDDALLRPGRFDYRLEIPLPDEKGVEEIFKISTKDLPLAENVFLKNFLSELEGFSGAEISFVARESAYNCLRRNMDLDSKNVTQSFNDLDTEKLHIENQDVMDAIERIKKGQKKT